jgi:PAS domain-containing protein
MDGNRTLASWLIAQRKPIEAAMVAQLGPAAPAASSPEAEALRRFRTFASSALLRGEAASPALDGLRVPERRTIALIEAWVEAAAIVAREEGEALSQSLEPLVVQFRLALRSTRTSRRSRGAPRAKRRAVVAAIDRVREAFLAIDTDTGVIEDANPAAGAILGVNRDALVGILAMSFVPREARSTWWTQLDAIDEGDETRLFEATLVDASGSPLSLDASLTRFATRGRTLALVLMRPSTRQLAHVAGALDSAAALLDSAETLDPPAAAFEPAAVPG